MAAADKAKTKSDVKDEEDTQNENENEGQEGTGKKGSKLTLIIIVVVVLLLLAGGGAAAYFFFFKASPVEDGKKPAAQEKPLVTIFWPMDPFIVNLSDNDGERYLKVVLQLELSDAKLLDEMKLLSPKLRDTILDLLSAKNYKEMMDPLGKQRLRDEIAMRINITVTKGKVIKVYFTEFIIQ